MDANDLNVVVEEINKILIKQEFMDRKNGEPQLVTMRKTDLLKISAKLIELTKKYFT